MNTALSPPPLTIDELTQVCIDLRGHTLACEALEWLTEQPDGIAFGAPHEIAATLRHARSLRPYVSVASRPHPTMNWQRQGVYTLTERGKAVAQHLRHVEPSVTGGGVYFIQGELTRLIKIGYARVINSRMTLLQCGSPDVLRLVWHYEAPQSHEAELHRIFASARAHGEWFRPEADLVNFILARRPALPKGAP
jgi:hypothetical protein